MKNQLSAGGRMVLPQVFLSLLWLGSGQVGDGAFICQQLFNVVLTSSRCLAEYYLAYLSMPMLC